MTTLHDPRPDLEADSPAWRQLLELASDDIEKPWGLYGLLRGIRSLGAELVPGETTWRIRPGAVSQKDYAEWRDEWLLSHKERLAVLLRSMAVKEAA